MLSKPTMSNSTEQLHQRIMQANAAVNRFPGTKFPFPIMPITLPNQERMMVPPNCLPNMQFPPPFVPEWDCQSQLAALQKSQMMRTQLFANECMDDSYPAPNDQMLLNGCDPIYNIFPPVTSESDQSYKEENDDNQRMGVRQRNPGVLSDPEVYFNMDDLSHEVFARKVFVGGLPIDVTEREIVTTFSQFGPMLVDWPRRSENQCRERSTGYVFLVFEEERSVRRLISRCHREGDKFYLFVSSPTMRDKPVQVRPWRLTDMEYLLNNSMSVEPRRTIFIGGVPRPTKASRLATLIYALFGSVCYTGIDIDPELKYPKGAARVTFTTEQAFIAAIITRFIFLPHSELNKRVEVKPYVMDEQMCDECDGLQSSGRFAQYFCGDVTCLQYYCDFCWDSYHYGEFSNEQKSAHKPLVRVGDQTKVMPHPPHHSHLPFAPKMKTPPECCRMAERNQMLTACYGPQFLGPQHGPSKNC